MATLSETFTNIANAIRNKDKSTAKISVGNFATAISNIPITINTITNYKYVLTINTNSGAAITATKSGSTTKTVTADDNGKALLTFTDAKDAGTWNISALWNTITSETTTSVVFS